MIYSVLSSQKPSQKLVILLHGYGANGQDLIDLGNRWAQELPQVDFLAPDAPSPCGQGGGGYEWFDLEDRTLEVLAQGAQLAASPLEAFIEKELTQRGLTYGDLVLMGFSQGAMMAFHMGMTLSLSGRVCGGIMGYSGMLLNSMDQFPSQFIYPPILVVHGDEDMVIPVSYAHEAAHSLKRVAPLVELFISRGLGHGIDSQGVVLGAKFLKSNLKNEK